MLTTLVLRQEVQLSVCRQDTAYVVFIKTQGRDNLAQSLYAIGQKWHQLKQSSPEKLTAPMRSVLFQHFVETIKQKFQQMLATPSSRSHALELGLISDNGNAIPGSAMGHDLQDARPGHPHRGHFSGGDQSLAGPALDLGIQGVCGDTFSRDAQAQRGVQLADFGDVPGDWQPHQRGQGNLGDPAQAQSVSSLDGRRMLPPSRRGCS